MRRIAKRLAVDEPLLLFIISQVVRQGAVPVSYTHLDVYKRQVLYIALVLIG